MSGPRAFRMQEAQAALPTKKVTCAEAATACALASGCGAVKCHGEFDDETVEIFNYKQGGEYQAVIEYKYVGAGVGDFEKIEVVTNVSGWWNCTFFFCGFAAVAVAIVIWFGIHSETTTTTTTSSAPGRDMTCTIFGDPHVMTFDSTKADYYQSGPWPLVRVGPRFHPVIRMDGLFRPTHATNGLSVLKKFLATGTFLKGNTLIIGVENAFYNGQPILTTFPSQFTCPPPAFCKIQYDSNGGVIQPSGREGKAMHVIHIELELNVRVQLNRWNEPGEGRYMNLKITMPQMQGVDGLCGNMNGNMLDDHRRAVFGRIGNTGIPASDSLFPDPPIPPNNEIGLCPDETLLRAHEECKASSITTSFWPSMDCLKAVCAGQTAMQWKAGQYV